MPEQLVSAEAHGTTLVLTLDRPAALNALSRTLVDHLADRLEEAAVDNAVRAVVGAPHRGHDVERHVRGRVLDHVQHVFPSAEAQDVLHVRVV